MEELLERFPELKLLPGRDRVRCSLSGHEMPCEVGVVQQYVAGKRFLRLRRECEYDYEKLRPLIVPSERKRKALYCRLTGRYLNRIPSHVETHMAGRRFTRAKQKYENEGRELRNEPAASLHQQKEDGEEEKVEEKKMEEEDVSSEEDRVDVKESVDTAVDEAPVQASKRKERPAGSLPLAKKKKLLKTALRTDRPLVMQ